MDQGRRNRLTTCLLLVVILGTIGCSKVFCYAPVKFYPLSDNLRTASVNTVRRRPETGIAGRIRELEVAQNKVSVLALQAFGHDNVVFVPGFVVANLTELDLVLDVQMLTFAAQDISRFPVHDDQTQENGQAQQAFGKIRRVFRTETRALSDAGSWTDWTAFETDDEVPLDACTILPGHTATFRLEMAVHGVPRSVTEVFWKKGTLDLWLKSQCSEIAYGYRFEYALM